MKKIRTLLTRTLLRIAISLFFLSAANAGENIQSSNGGVSSLRGMSELHVTRAADQMKRVQRDRSPIDRDYVYQPPLIPHQTRHYELSLNANKCLSCHSWKYAGEMGATKVSVTHFQSGEGQVLSDVSPRRYFCLQCHVTQADAKPLVGNDFERVKALR